MAADEPGEITELLRRVQNGDPAAAVKLVELVEARLRAIAAAKLAGRHEPVGVTDLVQEGLIKVVGPLLQGKLVLEGSDHFFALMAKAMTRLLIDHIRAWNAQKRSGGLNRVPLVDLLNVVAAPGGEVEIDEERVAHCLEALRQASQRAYTALYLRYFVGLGVADLAEQLSVSKSTVEKTLLPSALAFMRRCMESHS